MTLPLDGFVLASVRLGPLVWVGGGVIGVTARKPLVGATLLLALILAPLVPRTPAGDPVVLVLHELVVGVTMAFVLRTAYSAVEMAGEHIGRDLGLGEAETLLGEGGGASNLGALLVTWGVLAALLAGGADRVLIRLLARSYALVPPGTSVPGLFGASFAVVVDGAMRAAWVAAAPSIGLSLAVMLTLGLIGRAAPHINAYVASYPLRIALGLLLLGAAAPVLGRPLVLELERALELALGAVA